MLTEGQVQQLLIMPIHLLNSLNPDVRVDAAFLPLGEKCLKSRYEGYEYSLCLYKDVTQKGLIARGCSLSAYDLLLVGGRSTGGTVSLGKGGRWVSPGTEFVMEGGAACPNKVKRQTTVRFKCTTGEDSLDAMEEFEMCKYGAVVSTPAACIL